MSTPRLSDRVSSRVEPFWLNPATVKGTIAIAIGLFILAAPNISLFLLRLLLGGALVASGCSDLWFAARRRTSGRVRAVAEASVTALFGILLLFFPTETFRVLGLLISTYLAVRGGAIVWTALTARRRGREWGVLVVRGLLYISLAAVVLLLSDAVIEGLVVILAAAAVLLGMIMLKYGIQERSDDELIDIDVASVSEMLNSWLQERDIGQVRRESIGDGLFFEEPERSSKLASWWIMLMLSVAIATLGVIQDSTAVVIGAMLIAPLMTPILGTSAGIVNVWRGRVMSSAVLVLAGASGAIGLAFVIGQWVPIIVPLAQNSQVVSRVNPNVIDMLIALAAGAAGAYANVDDRVSDSIAGVAIAVALVPPLGVVGLTLQAGMFEDSLGALLLFLTNLVSIILAAAGVFFLTGYAPYRRIRESRTEIAAFIRTVALAALVIAIPLSLTAEEVLSSTSRQSATNQAVANWLDGTTLESVRIVVKGNAVNVFLTGPGDVPSLDSLGDELRDEFGEPVDLRVEHAPTEVLTYGDDDE